MTLSRLLRHPVHRWHDHRTRRHLAAIGRRADPSLRGPEAEERGRRALREALAQVVREREGV